MYYLYAYILQAQFPAHMTQIFVVLKVVFASDIMMSVMDTHSVIMEKMSKIAVCIYIHITKFWFCCM